MEVDFVTSDVLEEETLEIDENNENFNFEGGRCGICMDIIIDRGVLDCCQHWFCFGCIDNWATITNLCPLCQNEFQLITCVPVYDTIGKNKDEDDSVSRDDDWCIEGKNNSLSFPSYYIDENAVTCLDGDGCKIRSGSATIEEDSNLDTSIACDSCDIWYHAFCVGFDTESASEETWLCPRCAVDEVVQKYDSTSVQRLNNQCDLETSPSSCLAEVALSGKMSVSVADAGETAVVVSMIGNKWAEEPSKNFQQMLEVDKDLKDDTVPLDGDCIMAETSSSEKSDVHPIVEAQKLELSLSCHTSFSQPSNSSQLSELKSSCADEVMNDQSSSNGIKLSSGKLFNDSHDGKKLSEGESSMGLHLGLSVGSILSVDYTKRNGSEYPVTLNVQQQSLSDETTIRDERILSVANGEAGEIIGIKRKHTDCSDDALKIADDGEANAKKDAAVCAKKIKADRKFQATPSKDQDNALLLDESQKCATQMAALKDVKLKKYTEKEDMTSDIMSVVQGTGRRPSKGLTRQSPADKSSKERENAAGLRVKKIMRRATEDNESSVLVQNLRKEIREAVRKKSSAESGENIFDPKLLAAFRTAVAGPTSEPIKKLPPSALKAKKSILQKGKIRENLTKKIYGNSNGRRRRAWDRDCEVEFWKHRCMWASKPEKIATLKSVLNHLRKNHEGLESEQPHECLEKNPILSRLYLADTSVFPRKDDIKPLSALTDTSNSEQNKTQPISMGKGQKSPRDDHSLDTAEAINVPSKPGVPSIHDKGVNDKVPSSKVKAVSSKAPPDRGLEGSLAAPFGGSKVSSKKETNVQSDDRKIDKRKWALEVLARKTALSGKSTADEKQGDSAVLKGNYPLLAQLPKDMRPILAQSRHNKIPTSVRQTQLYRLTEHFLRKVNLLEMRRTADTELAVADATNIEKEVADRSNSKVVYLNLCSQEILHRADSSKPIRSTESNSSSLSAVPVDKSEQAIDELPTDPAVIDALKNAGLLSDSPPNSPCHKMEVPNEVDDSPMQIKEEEPDNVIEIDSHPDVDIYGDFEYDLEDEDYIGAAAMKISKVPPQDGESRMKVVFSTLKSERLNIQDFEDGKMLGNIDEPKDSPSLLKNHFDAGIISSTMEGGSDKSSIPSESLPSEEGEEPSLAECEELYGPDKEPLIEKFPEEASKKLDGLVGVEASSDSKVSVKNENYELIKGKNRTVASVGHSSCKGKSSPNDTQTSEKVPRKDKSRIGTNNQREVVNSVTKKVEAYIKEHIRPLCKSGIITAEQYRWAAAKTTEKVMKYHINAKNANFLIKEGEKVKILAEQYVEAAQQKDKGD